MSLSRERVQHRLHRLPLRVVSATGWSLAGQQQARRNALVASTALAEGRRERIEVEEFLAAHAARANEATGTDTARRGSAAG